MTGKAPELPSMFAQLMAAASHAAMQPERPRQWPLNPFPRGIRAGSATDKCLKALQANEGKWLEVCDLMRITGHSRGAIAWAMRYLGAQGLVRSIPSARHSAYKRYQAITHKETTTT